MLDCVTVLRCGASAFTNASPSSRACHLRSSETLSSSSSARWILARHRFHPVARAEHPRIEIEARRGRVSRRLERIDSRVEIGVAIPALGFGKARQFGIGNGEPALHRIEQLTRRATRECRAAFP